MLRVKFLRIFFQLACCASVYLRRWKMPLWMRMENECTVKKIEKEREEMRGCVIFLSSRCLQFVANFSEQNQNPNDNDNSKINQTNHTDSYFCRCHPLFGFGFFFGFTLCAFSAAFPLDYSSSSADRSSACPIQASIKSLQLICIMPMF